MEINGQSFTKDAAHEMLKVLEFHLVSEFGASEEEVQAMTFEDAKEMYESKAGYPAMYLQLVDKLKKRHFAAKKAHPKTPAKPA